jgi:hypothetical protein
MKCTNVLERRSRYLRILDRVFNIVAVSLLVSIEIAILNCHLNSPRSLGLLAPTAIMAGPTKSVILFKRTKPFTLFPRTMSSRTFPRQVSITSDHGSTDKFLDSSILSTPPPTMPKAAPLSILPLSSIIRSLAITSISSSPVSPTLFSSCPCS